MAGQVRVCAGAGQPGPGGAEDPGNKADRGADWSGLPFPVVCSATIWMERASIKMDSATTLDGMIVAVD